MKDNNGAELVGANGAEMANGANGFDIHQLGAVAEEVETL
jgi:hypothetical protein